MAKRFFYVCAGLLCLAVGYHIGVQIAGAQVGASYTLGGICTEGTDAADYVALVGRTVRRLRSGLPGGEYTWPIPGTDPVIAIASGFPQFGRAYYALLANGNCYKNTSGGGDWTYEGNVSGHAPVPAQLGTWGGVKARYARPQGKAGQARGDK